MFWRRRRRQPQAPPPTPNDANDGADEVTATAAPSHSYDDADYWERERLDPWGPARRAEEQRWARRRAEDVERARVAAQAVRAATQCDIMESDATTPYAAGFLSGVGLVTPAEFDARVDRAARLVMAVGDGRVPVAFDARDVMRSLTKAGIAHPSAGLFRSDLVTCLMDEAETARVRVLAKAASDREIARLLFQTPRVKPVVDAYGVWGIAPARSNDRGVWVPPKGAAARGPGLHGVGRVPPPVRGSPWDHYVDMYGSADDDTGGQEGDLDEYTSRDRLDDLDDNGQYEDRETGGRRTGVWS
ncbi:hypothetical protein pkur_cds_803 [Pandoravirus kuranda]|uniref:Uncharacterized protein n=1 Tax=Pandoravirus kuranda TaxID=3019033 RepID=A0AA95EDT4_9VIRU|nr:hypothetical protein pkur_cds_803 [Pandoravirus kuranda]